MKFFQKRGVAIAVLILAILASSAWGLHKAPVVSTPEGGEKLDPSLSTAAFTQYVRDEADILSDKTEEAVGLYNANWDKMFGSIMAVVTVQSSDDLENTAYDYAEAMQLGTNDAILLIAKQQQDYYLVQAAISTTCSARSRRALLPPAWKMACRRAIMTRRCARFAPRSMWS